MKIDLDKITKEMFERLDWVQDKQNDWRFNIHKITQYHAQQIALDAEIEKVKTKLELVPLLDNRQVATLTLEKILNERLAELNKMKEKL